MYIPTQNYSKASINPAEREAFRQAARKEAKERFNALLAEESFESEEQLKETLREYGEVELCERAYFIEEDADDLLERAGDPDISPETSFEFLVQSMVLEERLRVYDEVIEELRADNR